MERSSAGVRLLVADGIEPSIGEYGLVIETTGGAFAATIARGDSSAEEYHAALARIRDAIIRQLAFQPEPEPKPEPIKVGDFVMVHGYAHDGHVREITGATALITFCNHIWKRVPLANVRKVPA